MASSHGEQPPRPLENIAREVIGRYQALFVTDVLPGVIAGEPNSQNTEKIVGIFSQSLPEDPEERERFLSACESKDPSLTEIEGAYTAYMTPAQKKQDAL